MNNGGEYQQVQYGLIVQGHNTRRDFPAAYIGGLADSIREKGIVQPLVLHRDNGVYRIIAGECRWRAAGLAGLTEVPAIVHEGLTEWQIYALTTVENDQRKDLNPMEQAEGYARGVELAGSETAFAQAIGKPIAYVRDRLALLRLPEELQTLVRTDKLGPATGVALTALPDHLQMNKMVKDGARLNWQHEDYVRAVHKLLHAEDQLSWDELLSAIEIERKMKKVAKSGQLDLWSVQDIAIELGISKEGAAKWVKKCPVEVVGITVKATVGHNGNSQLALTRGGVDWIKNRRGKRQ